MSDWGDVDELMLALCVIAALTYLAAVIGGAL